MREVASRSREINSHQLCGYGTQRTIVSEKHWTMKCKSRVVGWRFTWELTTHFFWENYASMASFVTRSSIFFILVHSGIKALEGEKVPGWERGGGGTGEEAKERTSLSCRLQHSRLQLWQPYWWDTSSAKPLQLFKQLLVPGHFVGNTGLPLMCRSRFLLLIQLYIDRHGVPGA